MHAISPALAAEIADCLAHGMRQVTLATYRADIAAFGFRLDRAMDCRCMATDMATGRRFPCITSSARQIKTGAGFANTACERDENWRAFMAYRQEHFAVIHGAIFTV